jgi:hypothetical protein
MLVWACTENKKKIEFPKSIIYKSGNEAERETKKQMAR